MIIILSPVNRIRNIFEMSSNLICSIAKPLCTGNAYVRREQEDVFQTKVSYVRDVLKEGKRYVNQLIHQITQIASELPSPYTGNDKCYILNLIHQLVL